MTSSRSTPRPGGRSARVQASVHQATGELIAQHGRAALTVPLIAARAGVTPSTIYRRWGDLGDLLADVAVQRLRPESDPADLGSLHDDLHAWAEQYLDEMASEIGLAMMRDVLSGSQGERVPCQCSEFTTSQVAAIVERAVARGEAAPEVERVMDTVVSPIIYRALFGSVPATRTHVRKLVDACLKGAKRRVAASAA